jgi:predicted ATP-binding protein involved in virulence
LAKAKDGRLLPLRMLSDGVRNVLAMVADIAYRAAMLNPHLGRDAAKKTSGIVLIDEIDLHLHPSWQRHIVEDLHRTFPEIQFIATTHSPFIVQSLRKGKLLNLDPQESSEYYDQSIEDITENVMGVELPQKSERFLKMKAAAKEYYAVLEESQDASPELKEKLKIKLKELEMPYSDNPAYHAYLELKREAAGMSEE